MPPPLVEFEQKLHKATSSDDENSLPNVAVIAADINGWFDLSHIRRVSLPVTISTNSLA